MKKYFLCTVESLAFIICLLTFGAVQTACSSDDGQEGTKQRTDGRKVRRLTISDVPLTRATLSDNTNTLGASWNAGDEATLLNVSAVQSEILYGNFTAASDAATTTFTGSITCGPQDKLALIYPKVTLATDNGQFTINLSGQKGALDDVATRYHYVYGVGEVTSVTDNTATAVISSMQSLLAVAKFTFKDEDSGNAIPVQTLTINYGDASTGYPTTGTVTPNAVASAVAAAPSNNQQEWQPLTVSLDSETASGVYVTLFPINGDYFHFTVTNNNGTYTGTARATLKAGKYYPVTLTLTKQ